MTHHTSCWALGLLAAVLPLLKITNKSPLAGAPGPNPDRNHMRSTSRRIEGVAEKASVVELPP